VTNSLLRRLAARYRELEERCYRTSVATHRRDRPQQRDPMEAQVSAALLKKMDLDRALAALYDRFFGGE
jgi:hypothetical protein